MRLPDFVKLFDPLFKEMGITSVLEEIDIDIQLSRQGLEVDIFDPDLVKSSDGIFYKDRRVLVYIRDQYIEYDYKFHICYCGTLRQMDRSNRFNRYIATTNTSGRFRINLLDSRGYVQEEDQEIAMKVCKNCLAHLHYKEYSRNKTEIYENFDIKEFFELYGNFIGKTPQKDEFIPGISMYPPNWDYIAGRYKDKVGWKCEECGKALNSPELRKYLHVHHRNGDKSNNEEDNLIALCIECHAEQPYHGLVKSDPKLREFEDLKETRLLYDFFAGDIVRHPTFGVGRIRRMQGHGPEMQIVVDFAEGITKTLMAKYAKLEVVEQ